MKKRILAYLAAAVFALSLTAGALLRKIPANPGQKITARTAAKQIQK